MTTPAQQACLDAADLIERDGWWRKEGDDLKRYPAHPVRWWQLFRKPSDTYCAVTALLHATSNNDIRHRAWDAVMQQIDGYSLSAWNDSQTSAEPVISALRKAGGL